MGSSSLPNLIVNVPISGVSGSQNEDGDDGQPSDNQINLSYFDPIDDLDFFKPDPDSEEKKPVTVNVYLGDVNPPPGLKLSSLNGIEGQLDNDNLDNDETQVEGDEQDAFRVRRYANPDAATFAQSENNELADQNRLELRQKRFFGQLLDVNAPELHLSDRRLKKLYQEFQVDPSHEDDESRLVRPKLNTLHVRGVNKMSTKDVFEYFGAFAPPELEWINDNSCNVIFSSAKQAAKALLIMGILLKRVSSSDATTAAASTNNLINDDAEDFISPLKREETIETSNSNEVVVNGSQIVDSEQEAPNTAVDKSQVGVDVMSIRELNTTVKREPIDIDDYEILLDSDEDMGVTDAFDNQTTVLSTAASISRPKRPAFVEVDTNKYLIPPGVWRVGNSNAKSELILLRYATNQDVKVQGAARQSEYYRRYGNPNYGGMRGLISRSLRRRMDRERFGGDLRTRLSRKRTHDSRGIELAYDEYYEMNADGQWRERWQHDDRNNSKYLESGAPCNEVKLKYEPFDLDDADRAPTTSVFSRLSTSSKMRGFADYSSGSESSGNEKESSSSSTLKALAPPARRFKMRMRADEEEQKLRSRQKRRRIEMYEENLRAEIQRDEIVDDTELLEQKPELSEGEISE